MIGNYKVAHLLGIARGHEEQFRHIERELTKQGYICFCPAIYDIDVYKQYLELLDDMCYQKLLVCDICVVATPEHIGKSTNKRIHQAYELGKSVYIFENGRLKLFHYNIGDKVETKIHFMNDPRTTVEATICGIELVGNTIIKYKINFSDDCNGGTSSGYVYESDIIRLLS